MTDQTIKAFTDEMITPRLADRSVGSNPKTSGQTGDHGHPSVAVA
jgi:hypothetical protein